MSHYQIMDEGQGVSRSFAALRFPNRKFLKWWGDIFPPLKSYIIRFRKISGSNFKYFKWGGRCGELW